MRIQADSGNPSTSDANDAISVNLGRKLFEIVGVSAANQGPAKIGAALDEAVIADLTAGAGGGLSISGGRATAFRQYSHLKAFADFKREVVEFPDFDIASLLDRVRQLPSGTDRSAILRSLNALASGWTSGAP